MWFGFFGDETAMFSWSMISRTRRNFPVARTDIKIYCYFRHDSITLSSGANAMISLRSSARAMSRPFGPREIRTRRTHVARARARLLPGDKTVESRFAYARVPRECGLVPQTMDPSSTSRVRRARDFPNPKRAAAPPSLRLLRVRRLA